MVKVYLASPFFDKEQLERIEKVEQALEANPTVTEVFSPRKAVYEAEFGSLEWRKQAFNNNATHIMQADVVVAVYDYEDKHTDAGTAWEMGFAVGLEVPLVVFQEKDVPVNLMMSDSLTAYIKTPLDLSLYDFEECPNNKYEGEVF